MFKTEKINYQDADTRLEAYCAYEETTGKKKPAVLVVHDWSGKNDFACQKAEKLAELGYIGFALDMYGKGKTGTTKEEKSALMQPLMQDRFALQKRVQAAFDTVKKMDAVDPHRIAIIGFCFGGLCALDLARSGVDIKAAVSFHGLLVPPENVTRHPIKSKILVLHGYDDPMVSPQAVMDFADEMTAARADWQLTMFGNTMHAFMNPDAHDPDFGTVYNRQTEERSWNAMKAFFEEVL